MCVHTHTHTHTLKISLKKNEIVQFETTWMDLEGVILSEISQRETHALWFHLYMEPKNQNKWTNMTKQKESHRYREQTGVARGEWVGGRREISKGD